MTSMITSPFQAPANLGPRTARLEILERHDGPDRLGQDMPLKPNLLRVNGVALWATVEDPVVVREVRVDGRVGVPLVVVIGFHARSLAIGAESDTDGVAGNSLGGNKFAMLAVPGLIDEPGEVSAAYVTIDGMKILLGGPVVVRQMKVGEPVTSDVLTVDVPLLCRSVVFDDERIEPKKA